MYLEKYAKNKDMSSLCKYLIATHYKFLDLVYHIYYGS